MSNLMRGRAALMAVVAVMVLVGSAFLSISQGTQAQDAKVLRVHQVTFPDIADPHRASFSSEIAVLSLNYEGLTKQDNDLNTVPGAAESWEFNEDLTQITFHLRDGLTYSDGSPLTAERFRFAIERTCHPATAGQYPSILFDVAGCAELNGTDPADTAAVDAALAALGATAPDDQTLVVDLVSPAPYFPTVASLWVLYPAQQELIEQGGEGWWMDPALQLGNGAFQMSSFDEGLQIGFVANENYWGGRPLLDGIEYVYQGESSIAIEAFRAGDLDIVKVDAAQIPVVTADPDLADNYLQFPVASTYTLSFNLTMEPFTDIKVREAFSLAFDRETYCSIIRNGDCNPTLSWIPAGIPGAIETDLYGFDPEAAVAALAASSYGGPDALPPLTMYFNSNDSANTARAEWVAGQIRDILGIEITLAPTEGTALTELRKEPTTYPHMLLTGSWIQDYPDPQNWLSVYWKCESTFAQRVAYCNEEFDAIVTQADQLADPAERMPLYQQAGEILVNDIPAPFLYNLTTTVLVADGVTGFTPTALDVEWPGQFTSQLTLDKSA